MSDRRVLRHNYDDSTSVDEDTTDKHSSKSKMPSYGTIAKGAVIVGGVVVAGLLIWKFWPKNTDWQKDIELDVEVLTPEVAPGDDVRVNASITNISTKVIEPMLRLDLKKNASFWTSVNEGSWVSYGSIAAGATVTKELSMQVPSDWYMPTDMKIYGRIVMNGTSGTIWEEQAFTIPGSLQSVEVDDVIAVNATVVRGAPCKANVFLTNDSSISQTIRIRLDIKNASKATWNEGQFVSVTVPGSTSNKLFQLSSINVPIDWSPGSKISAKIQIDGISGPSWGTVAGDNFIFTISTAPASQYGVTTSFEDDDYVLAVAKGTSTITPSSIKDLHPGNYVKVIWLATNQLTVPVTIQHELQLRAHSAGQAWHDHSDSEPQTVQSTTIAAGATVNMTTWRQIPLDWFGTHYIDWKVVIVGISGSGNIEYVDDSGTGLKMNS